MEHYLYFWALKLLSSSLDFWLISTYYFGVIFLFKIAYIAYPFIIFKGETNPSPIPIPSRLYFLVCIIAWEIAGMYFPA